MGNKAPPPPDYQGAAQAQGAASQANTGAQTQANRPGQSTGFAGSQWVQDPQTGAWTQKVGLEGPLGTAQGEGAAELASVMGTPLDTGEQARDKAVSQTFGSEMSMLQPQLQQAKEQTDSQLSNEGLAPTSEAARAQENQLGTSENQAISNAMGQAENIGNQAQQITFGENVTGRELPLQQLQGLLGLEAQPGFQGAGVAQTPEYLAAAMGLGNYELGANQQNNALLGSMGQGGGQLAGAVGSALPFLL